MSPDVALITQNSSGILRLVGSFETNDSPTLPSTARDVQPDEKPEPTTDVGDAGGQSSTRANRPDSARELEHRLRAMGYSAREARRGAGAAWTAIRREVDELAAARKALERLAALAEGIKDAS